MSSPGRTAVLVFAKTAEVDLCRRFARLSHGLRARLGCALQRQVRREALASGLPCVFSTEREQRGATYGERLVNACEDALAAGYERLVVVGGDCPGLRARHLREAAAALAEGQFVVGRDRRGGAYLIGFDMARVPCRELAHLPYRRPQFADALWGVLARAYGERVGGTALGVLGDVHDEADLRRERPRFREAGIRGLLGCGGGAFAKTRHTPPAYAATPNWHSVVVGHCGPPSRVPAAR